MSRIADTANTAVKALRTQPLALALILMNVVFVGYLWYYTTEINRDRQQYLVETQRLLASCIHVEDLEKVLKPR